MFNFRLRCMQIEHELSAGMSYMTSFRDCEKVYTLIPLLPQPKRVCPPSNM